MKLILINLTIINFKGIRKLSIDFDPRETSIYAANEVGKTTISDAWHWLLTGKNSVDQKDFNIKNTVHTELNRADHEVSATLMVEGNQVTLKKIYREKWTKKRGEQYPVYDGNETEHFFNGVPVQQFEYQAKVNGLMAENVLKMITNPLYFNTNNNKWGWQDRRNILLNLAGNISNDEVFDAIRNRDNEAGILALQEIISAGQTIADHKKVIANQKNKIKADLIHIPSRIDEANRSMPEVLDWAAIQKGIDARAQRLQEIEDDINDKAKAAQRQNIEILQRQNEIHELTTRKNTIRFEVSNQLNQAGNERNAKQSQLQSQINNAEREINNIKSSLNTAQVRLENLETDISKLRKLWAEDNASELKFNEHEFSCPACHRAFDSVDIESKKSTLTENFNNNKTSRLQNINSEGVALTNQKNDLIASIDEFNKQLSAQTSALEALRSQLSELIAEPLEKQNLDEVLANNDEFVQLSSRIAALSAKNTEMPQVDNNELLAEKKEITGAIDELKRSLGNREQIAKTERRILELKNEECDLSQKLADLENTEFLIEQFDKSKMDIMESRVNGKFQYVTFKLFNRQVNGAEDPTCETMYSPIPGKGVPFNDLNTAGKIWAGIDIINTLCAHYGIHAPIFLDNRESVSRIPYTASQVVNLVVSPADLKIRVESGKPNNYVAELATA